MAEDDGVLPLALLNKPELLPYQQTILHAFFLLCPDRPIGGMGGVGAIPTLAIYAMADEIGEDRQTFLVLCRAMDGAYMEHLANARKK